MASHHLKNFGLGLDLALLERSIAHPAALTDPRGGDPRHRPVCIVVRETLHWADTTLVDTHIIPKFRPAYELWNATMSIPYAHFRHRLKEIAESSLRRVRGAEITTSDQVPRDAICAPIDDDDWFAPNLVERIRDAYDPQALGYRWRRWELQVERPLRRIRIPLTHRSVRVPLAVRRARRFFFGEQEGFSCLTNNYALVYEPALRHQLLRHVEASVHFDRNPSRYRRVRGTLAVQNRNLASQTIMRQIPVDASDGRRELARWLDRYRGCYERSRIPLGSGWAEPYVAKMAELMRDLKLAP